MNHAITKRKSIFYVLFFVIILIVAIISGLVGAALGFPGTPLYLITFAFALAFVWDIWSEPEGPIDGRILNKWDPIRPLVVLAFILLLAVPSILSFNDSLGYIIFIAAFIGFWVMGAALSNYYRLKFGTKFRVSENETE